MDSQTPQPPTPPHGVKPIRRPVATGRPVPVRVKKRWDFLEIFLWLAILGGGGAFAYYRLHPRPAVVAEESADAKKSRAATPAPVAAEPAPAIAPEPAAPAPAPMLAKETAPRDEPARPAATTPAPAATASAQPLVLDENAGKKAENLQRSQAALDTALLSGKWTDYLDLLDRALAAELKKATGIRAPADYDRFLGNPLFAKALVQRTTLRHLPSAALAAVTDRKSVV